MNEHRKSAPYVVVIGGVNLDIGGRSKAALVAADSNPGHVTMTLGGVGRNIAHNLRLLNIPVYMLTALGSDLNGGQVTASCAQLGIDLRYAKTVPGGRTSTYLYLTDPEGELALAVSDMEICEQITPEYLASHFSILEDAAALVADANIPSQSLVWLARHFGAKLFADPVSTAKAVKLRPVLHMVHTLKPNRLEAQLLTDIPVTDRGSAARAVRALLSAGVRQVFLSMGSDGVCAGEGDQILFLDALPGVPVNTTGCGDAFMAALLWASLHGRSLADTARAGLAAGSIAMESELTIAPHLCESELISRMG